MKMKSCAAQNLGQFVGYDRGVEEEAQRSLLIRQLTRKIGAMPVSTIDRISNLPIEQLESLGEALLDFGSIDDLTSWLETQG